ncbi:MAG: DUF3048 domain-containing protein [Candidatus Kerfeldbacteria bacterium]|nr:DUF3048 domain-containing protein [Candidatus Kerfeldbacteria bacterium]
MTEDNISEETSSTEATSPETVNGQRKKKIAVILVAAIVVCGLIIVLAVMMMNPNTSNVVTNDNANQSINAEELPKKVQRTLDGVSVERGEENFLPIAVMIENANFGGVRPQSGLQEASVVYEALAEGGITRFLAVFADTRGLERVGPVRSARPYYVDWAEEYQGVYLHAGGSPQALQKLSAQDVMTDVNQVSGATVYFFRDPHAQSREHGLFTSTELIGYLLRDYTLADARGTFTPWKFQQSGLAKDQRPTDARTISIPFSTSGYQVDYTYTSETNSYLRNNGGIPHTDTLTGEQIHVKNVVVQYVRVSTIDSTGRLSHTTTGSGNAVVFYNGEPHTATWKKEAESARTIFYDETGEEIQFIPGNIWIEVVPTERTVIYTQPTAATPSNTNS